MESSTGSSGRCGQYQAPTPDPHRRKQAVLDHHTQSDPAPALQAGAVNTRHPRQTRTAVNRRCWDTNHALSDPAPASQADAVQNQTLTTPTRGYATEDGGWGMDHGHPGRIRHEFDASKGPGYEGRIAFVWDARPQGAMLRRGM
ncbi:MAG: hypothetical protein L6435_18050 [Anaerolineae bacterium]|nr:hypothetical protein [Anaerolineae bacterium]